MTAGSDKRICLAAVAGAHGVRGEFKLKTFTAREEDAAAYGPVTTEDGRRTLTLKIMRRLKPGLVLAVAPEIATREEAQGLAGARLYAPRAALPPIEEEDAYYHEDLIGLDAVDEGGGALGRVSAVHNFGAGDIIEIGDRPDGGRALLVPFTKAAAPEVDLEEGRIVIAASAIDGAAKPAISDQTGEIVSADLEVDLHAMREEDA